MALITNHKRRSVYRPRFQFVISRRQVNSNRHVPSWKKPSGKTSLKQEKHAIIDCPETSRYTFDVSATGILTEADILKEVVDPNRSTFSPQLVKELLSLKFNDDATNRIRDLLQKNNSGTISPAEKSTLDNYLRVGEFLDLIQAKARLRLHQNGSSIA